MVEQPRIDGYRALQATWNKWCGTPTQPAEKTQSARFSQSIRYAHGLGPARGAGPGVPFSRVATPCQVTWGAPFGRGVKRPCPKHSLQPKHSLRSWAGPRSWGRPFALLRLLTRTGPKLAPRVQRVLWVLPARRVARLTASRLAVSINPWLFDH